MESNKKEYDKLSLDQFKHLISELKEVKNQDKSLQDLVKDIPKENMVEILGKDLIWSSIYEFSFLEHLALVMLAMNKLDFIKQVKQSEDPTQYFIDNFEYDDNPDHFDGGWNGLFEKSDLVGLLVSLQRSILSIMIYQKTIHSLVEEVKNGSDDALFDAVRLDRSITSCPTIAKRITLAEFKNEKMFFLRLRSALKGPSQRHWESYQDLRYALFVLRESGFNELSDDQLEELLVNQLMVYPKTYNARKNLRKQYTESKKIKNLK